VKGAVVEGEGKKKKLQRKVELIESIPLGLRAFEDRHEPISSSVLLPKI